MRYFVLLFMIPIACTNSTNVETITHTLKGNWKKVVSITKFNNNTSDYSENVFELNFCTDDMWIQYIRGGDQTKKYEWEYIFDGDELYRYYPGSNCGKKYKFERSGDTIILEDSLLIHKMIKFDSKEIPSHWPADLLVVDMDSANVCN